jgi:microsomal dipeptidase-like Zn-dependent dipeptidase
MQLNWLNVIILCHSNVEAIQDAKKNKQYEALEQQLKLLVESYGEATQQLGHLKESVDESKELLKANIEKEENAETDLREEDNGECGKIDQDHVAVVVEMQGIFQQSDIRDEELASLESIAGLVKCIQY